MRNARVAATVDAVDSAREMLIGSFDVPMTPPYGAPVIGLEARVGGLGRQFVCWRVCSREYLLRQPDRVPDRV
jgi:hypothetical protein